MADRRTTSVFVPLSVEFCGPENENMVQPMENYLTRKQINSVRHVECCLMEKMGTF